jgi:hypothetical protein
MCQYLISLWSPTVRGYFFFLAIICVGEVFFHLTFALVSRVLGLIHPGIKAIEVFKGIIERLMLSVGVAHGIPTVIIAFGALKVATKLSLSAADTDQAHVARHNDYFVIGNVLSILFAIIYALIATYAGFVTINLGSVPKIDTH